MDPGRRAHARELAETLARWQRKPLLGAVYDDFYRHIGSWLRRDLPGPIVEIGSGIGNLRRVVPGCLLTDIVASPWIDWVQDAYALSLPDGAASNLVLFDVWHHLEFPGTALAELRRALAPGGRLILFEPALSLVGWIVYGLAHHEPVGWGRPITWLRPEPAPPARYYSAQGNATRIFRSRAFARHLAGWRLLAARRLATLSYVASGGYRGPQLYPQAWLPFVRQLDRLADLLPALFATRLLVVLEKLPPPA